MNDAASFVYLIQEGDDYKIGKSIAPAARMRSVAGTDALLVHVIPSANPFQVENALHRRFGSVRIEGAGREWFRLEPEDVEAICRLGRTDTADDLPPDLQRSTVPNRSRAVLSFRPDAEVRCTLASLARRERRTVASMMAILVEEGLIARGLLVRTASGED